MKTEIYKIGMITCVLIVLGTHALLSGNWRFKPAKPVKSDKLF